MRGPAAVTGEKRTRAMDPAVLLGYLVYLSYHFCQILMLASRPRVGSDTELNDDLVAEGYARDVIRSVQDARKAAGLEVSDHIALKLTVPAGDVAKVEQFRDLVSADTLADSLDVVAGAEGSEPAIEVAKA